LGTTAAHYTNIGTWWIQNAFLGSEHLFAAVEEDLKSGVLDAAEASGGTRDALNATDQDFRHGMGDAMV
jgi:TRAP-type C4-dicarboxylate transport system substrate-binding protein